MTISKAIRSCIQFWLNATGKKVDFEKYPFLKGPMANDENIDEEFSAKLAKKEGLKIEYPNNGGLLLDFKKVIDPKGKFADHLLSEIPKFYEQTAIYKMEVWSKWIPPISYAAKLLIKLVSVEMKQLNIPLNPLETSYGMSSSIVHLTDGKGAIKYACWLRKSIKSNQVVYAGYYSSFKMGDLPYEFVRVVFPMPKGNVTVILKVEVMEDGSVKLISNGKKFGGSGYYRLNKNNKGVVKARMIPIKETIHVFKDKKGVLRTDHFFKWWKMTFLQLHYQIIEK